MKQKGLGKGLGALISSQVQDDKEKYSYAGVLEVDINNIEPNKEQPRKYFDDETLIELSQSLKQYGVIQPIIVKQEDGYFSIIAGERRWRAARIAKLETVPVIIKDYTQTDVLQIALIENLQRQDLNPIEEALCYRRLVDEYFFTQEQIAEKVSKSRNSISYAISLLNLDERVQNLLIESKLTSGHGRILLNVTDGNEQFELAEKIIDEELSVRETQILVKLHIENKEEKEEQVKPQKTRKSAEIVHVEKDLMQLLGTKVNLRDNKNKGKIEIEYYSLDELERLLLLFKKMES